MTIKAQPGFRFVPWRFSWRTLALVFLMFMVLNYTLVHYCSRHALLGQASEGESIKAAQTALSDESQELQKLRQVIQQLRATSSSQRETIQEMQKTVAAAGGKLMNLSVELNALRHSNDDLFRVAADQEKTLLSVENSLTDVKRDLQLVEDTMLRSGLRPK